MRARVALLLLLSAPPGLARAQDQNTGSIKYSFQTLLTVDPPKERSVIVEKGNTWFMGKANPVRMVALEAAVAIPGTPITFAEGTLLAVADSPYFVACSDKVAVMNGMLGMGKAPVCLIDMDRDGGLDSWYKSSVPIVWSRFSGHIQRDDIHPITPTRIRELSGEEIRKLSPSWDSFLIMYAKGRLRNCQYFDFCTDGPRITPTDIEQTVEFEGGLFAYRAIDKKHLAVRMVREPREAIY